MCYLVGHGIYASFFKIRHFFSMPNQSPKKPTNDAARSPLNLATLAAQVLTQPPAAALPCNLTDEWLDSISRDLEDTLGVDAPPESDRRSFAAPLALVLHILAGQQNDVTQAWPLEDILARLQKYQFEIALEQLNRRTAVRTTPATMETIFKRDEINVEIVTRPEDTGN